jgi:hypothetical protein
MVGIGFGLIGGVFWLKHQQTPGIVAGAVGGVLLFGGIVVPGLLGPLYRAWMGLAKVLSRFTTPIVMGVIYFVVFTPVGLIARAFGHRPLKRARTGSYWIDRPAGSRQGDLTRQF